MASSPGVLHLTAHLGGGVGRVLTALIGRLGARDGGGSHELIAFERLNPAARRWSRERGIPTADEVAPGSRQLDERIRRADIVQLHFWNHPLTIRFLANPHPPARLVVWSHVNGHAPPQTFTAPLLDCPQRFVVSTPFSLEHPLVQARPASRFAVIHSTAGQEHVAHATPRPHDGLEVGYVGTVDPCKLSPRFLDLCARVDVPGVRFVVCGGPGDRELAREVQRRGLAGRVEVRGHVDDVVPVLEQLDVFGYPLRPGHYGTGEQALLEAMACGVVPVVLDNGPEAHVVEHGVTGLVARSEEDWVHAVEGLLADPTRRARLGQRARDTVRARYGLDRSARQWQRVYEALLEQPKRAAPPLGGVEPPDAAELLLLALGDTEAAALHREALDAAPAPGPELLRRLADLPDIFFSPTRGSAFHYGRCFPDDQRLAGLCEVLSAAAEERAA